MILRDQKSGTQRTWPSHGTSKFVVPKAVQVRLSALGPAKHS